MTREAQLDFLIYALSPSVVIPQRSEEKWRLFRSLANMREAAPVRAEFLKVQDAPPHDVINEKGITDAAGLPAVRDTICIWHGDITTLKVDAIVNAVNSGMFGCSPGL